MMHSPRSPKSSLFTKHANPIADVSFCKTRKDYGPNRILSAGNMAAVSIGRIIICAFWIIRMPSMVFDVML